MVKLTYAHLTFVRDEARKIYLETPAGVKLDNSPYPLVADSLIAISYIMAVDRLRAKIGDFEIEFVTPDSSPQEEDY